MTDPVEITSTIAVVGSRMKAEAFAGMDGDPQASSLLPGETVKRGTVAKKLMAGPTVTAHAGEDFQTRAVSPEQKVPTAFGQRSRSGEGGKIPAATSRRDKNGAARPTR